ncbi:MAG: translocation/assembly module TamB domain-containing protein [Asticcacaulis sp.]|uniref:translocation/assembly module TamB domain-containing protein n=1 Tax=Asticcacaulis sp. TaxID=1872648 RepID=UPI0039E34C16
MARRPKNPKPPVAPKTPEATPEALPQPAPAHEDDLSLKDRVETATEEVVETVKARTGFDLRRINWLRVSRNITLFVVGLAVLLVAALAALNTAPGRRLLVEFATGIKLNSGLQIEIREIDGSLYGDMTLHDVRIKDLKGVFIQSPLLHLDWRPFGYLNRHIDIRDFSSPRIEVLRQPVLNPDNSPKSNGPLLPDLYIDLNRLKVDALVLDAPVMGEAHTLAFDGQAHLRHKRLKVEATAVSEKDDRAKILIDAAPDRNQLDISADLNAPANGVAAKLIGFDKAFTARIGGAGTWKQWNGRAIADFGSDNLLNLNITAQSGTFHIAGATHPDLILGGDTAILFKPAVTIDLTSKMKDRVFDNVLALYTDALRIDAKGTLDLGKNRFHQLELHARLLKPDVLGKDFTASDLRADLIVDGDFEKPRIDYDLAAKRFDLSTGKDGAGIKLDGFTAKGKSRVTDGGVIVPINAQLTSLTGIAAQVDPLLTHLKLDGEVRLDDGKLTSNTIRVSSDRLKATGSLSGNLKDNLIAAKVKASLNNYDIDGVGTVNVSTVADLKLNKGKFSVAGTADAQTTKLSDSLKGFLGGNAKLSGAYAYTEQGVVALRSLSGKSPDFTLTSAEGSLAPNGAISLNAKASSAQYGALDATASGTLDHPNAILHAANPDLGVKMVDVTARLSSTPEGFALLADGGSAYGPFSADALVMTSGSPLRIDIHKATFAGIDAAGLLTQDTAGPFTGSLAISGSGLKGTALLSVQGGDQAVAVNATGNSVTLPGDLKLYVGRTLLTANIVLHDQMSLNADVQMADMRYQDFVLATGRARIQMTGEHGTIQAVATGKKDVPFNLAVNGTIAPDTYSFAAQGAANAIAFRLNHPAVIRKSGADWVLQPVKVVMDQGNIDLSGRFGENTRVQVRLNTLDLSLANMVQKDLGLTGTADGAIDFTQTGNGFPTARANLKISHFSRASAAVVSTPVDIALDAQLNPDRSPTNNYVHAIIRQGMGVIGRAQIALSPASGGDWIADINSGGVSGGVRYNGPAGVPFSLAGLPRQQLSGAVALAADISGQLNAPRLNGVVKATSLTYDNESIGTRITAIALDGRFTNDRLELTSFTGRAGEGTVKGNGWVSLAAAQKFPMQIHVEMTNARLARSDAINSTISGTIDVTNSEADGGLVKGDLRLPQLKYTIAKQAAAEVTVLDGVRRKGDDDTTQSAVALPAFWKLDISARADNQIFVSGMGLESEWSARLRVTGTTKDPRLVGEMKVVRGTYTFAGRSFDIDSGTITFDGGPVTDPEISLTASADVQDITGTIKVSGSAERPDIAFSSSPSLPQDEILSRLLFGESVANISPTEALQLASAVNGLNGGTDYLNPLGALRSATGIDRLRMVSADTSTGRGTSVAAGKYITNNVYVEFVTDAKGFTATQLEVALSRSLSILSTTGNAGTGASVRFSKDY